jgi:hypothetical protein
MLDRALAWARQGWPVFPCTSTGHPAIKEWQKKATTDEATIRAWDWTDARVAAVPGLAGCFVIDVDVKNGKDGEASLTKLEAEHGFEAWEFPQQETPSGGRHLFLSGQFRTTVQRALGEGIDTRGGTDGSGLGFVFAYEDAPCCAAHDCPAAPASLLAVSEKANPISEDRETPRVELDQPANVERALAYVRNLPSPDEGQRNISVFKTACTLKDLGLSLSKIFEVLEDHPSVTGTPPLCEENEEEFNATVRSAYKNGQRQPGIDAIDEEARNAAASGYDVGPVSGDGRPSSDLHSASRKRLGLWSERKNRPPPEWLVRGLLTKSSLAGLYGPGGSYKSFIALDMAAAIATGQAQWGGRNVTHGPVVFISGEGSVEPRALAIETRGIQITDNFAILDGINLDDTDQLAEAVDDINTAIEQNWGGQAPVLIVVDTLARAAPGQDENSAKDMGRVVASCDGFRKLYGCCVLLVHHTPKGGHDWRGSTAVWNALDTGLAVKRTGLNHASLKVERQKDGAIGQVWKIALEKVETGRERDDEKESSLVISAIEAVAQEERKAEDAEKVAAAARARSMTVNDHRAQCAARILGETAPGYEVSYGALVAQIMVENQGASREAVSEWVRSVVKKGEVQGEHPLAKFVSNIKPLAFQRVSEEM